MEGFIIMEKIDYTSELGSKSSESLENFEGMEQVENKLNKKQENFV